MTAGFGAPDPVRLAALRRMKIIAGVMLIGAALVYGLCRWVGDSRGVWGYLGAAAEASMVGGLADWFAVTALFRHPLRLPIPHTAIIPRKKDQIVASLAGFVSEHFFTPEIIRERVAQAQVPQRLGEWLADPAHAAQVSGELSRAFGGVAGLLRDDELRDAVAAFADRRLRDADISAPLARIIDAVCDSGQHQKALTAVLKAVAHFLADNQSVFRDRVSAETPDWVPDWVDDRVFAKGYSLVQSFLSDVVADEGHALRKSVEDQLRAFAERLRTDPAQQAKIEEVKLEVLDHPQVRSYLAGLWSSVKQLLLDGAGNPDSELRRSVERLTTRAGEALRDDPAVVTKAEDAVQRITHYVVEHYADDLTAVISTTVERWDTEQTSRRLELQVGRDLQFIRINGTVVGALAGLVIYAISRLF
jgi:uncharacterized membrane-anchored protein YjiN (DUF445 family)